MILETKIKLSLWDRIRVLFGATITVTAEVPKNSAAQIITQSQVRLNVSSWNWRGR